MPLAPSPLALGQPGLCWETGLPYSVPQWTKEPSLDTIEYLSRQYLPVTDEQTVNVTFLAEGTFNKLYTISYTGEVKNYVFRVSLPVEPFYKTESEVTTLRYIRYTTTVPVPRVLAYNSSAENELGFEWILMDKVPGCALQEVWGDWGEDAKASVVREVAGYAAEMREKLGFTAVGSLYYRRAMEKAALEDPTIVFESVGNFPHILLGPIVSPLFFSGQRARMRRDRGPFRSDYEFMKAGVQVQMDYMEFLLKSKPSEGNYGRGEDSVAGSDKDLAEDSPDTIQAYSSLYSLLPSIFPPEPEMTEKMDTNSSKDTHGPYRFVLHHDDFSLRNILVDPKTYRINGVVDWECVYAHPRWEERIYPKFLTGPVVGERPPPLLGEDKDNNLLVQRMQDWEKTVLRRVFDEELELIHKRKRLQDISHDCEAAKRKRDFKENLGLAESSPNKVNRWIKEVKIELGQEGR